MTFLSRKVENLILRVTMNFINLNLVQFFFFSKDHTSRAKKIRDLYDSITCHSYKIGMIH